MNETRPEPNPKRSIQFQTFRLFEFYILRRNSVYINILLPGPGEGE